MCLPGQVRRVAGARQAAAPPSSGGTGTGPVTGGRGQTRAQPVTRALSAQAPGAQGGRARVRPCHWPSPGAFCFLLPFPSNCVWRRQAPVAPAQRHLSGPPHLGIKALGGCLGIAGGLHPPQPSPCWVVVALVCTAGGMLSPPWLLLGEARCCLGGSHVRAWPARGLDSGRRGSLWGAAPSGGQLPCRATLCHRHDVWSVHVAFASLLCFLGCKCWDEVPWGRPRCPCKSPRLYQLFHLARHTAAAPCCCIPVTSWGPLVTTMETWLLPTQGAPAGRIHRLYGRSRRTCMCVVYVCHVCCMYTCVCVCVCCVYVCMCARVSSILALAYDDGDHDFVISSLPAVVRTAGPPSRKPTVPNRGDGAVISVLVTPPCLPMCVEAAARTRAAGRARIGRALLFASLSRNVGGWVSHRFSRGSFEPPHMSLSTPVPFANSWFAHSEARPPASPGTPICTTPKEGSFL